MSNRSKLESYLGFAKKSNNLVMGSETCGIYISKKKMKLIIFAGEVSDNTKDKLMFKAKKYGITCMVYNGSKDLSAILGSPGRKVFGIVDSHFASIIKEVIELEGGKEV